MLTVQEPVSLVTSAFCERSSLSRGLSIDFLSILGDSAFCSREAAAQRRDGSQ